MLTLSTPHGDRAHWHGHTSEAVEPRSAPVNRDYEDQHHIAAPTPENWDLLLPLHGLGTSDQVFSSRAEAPQHATTRHDMRWGASLGPLLGGSSCLGLDDARAAPARAPHFRVRLERSSKSPICNTWSWGLFCMNVSVCYNPKVWTTCKSQIHTFASFPDNCAYAWQVRSPAHELKKTSCISASSPLATFEPHTSMILQIQNQRTLQTASLGHRA